MTINRRDPLEAKLEASFVKTIQSLGGMSLKLVPTLAGPPDRLVLLGGRLWLVELKRSDGRLSSIQRIWHERVEQRGAPVYVLWGEAGVKSWLRAVTELPSKESVGAPLSLRHWLGYPTEHDE